MLDDNILRALLLSLNLRDVKTVRLDLFLISKRLTLKKPLKNSMLLQKQFLD